MALDANLAIAASVPLLEKAVLSLEQARKRDPSDWEVALKLADKLRQLGRLPDAREVYAAVLALNPECLEAAWVLNILTGADVIPDSRPGSAAVPFILCDNFLPEETLIAAWDRILSSAEEFSPSKVSEGLAPQVRNSNMLNREALSGFDQAVLAAVESQVTAGWSRLGLAPLEIVDREIELVSHTDGEFYHVHADSVGTGPYSKRKVTFVIYLVKEPRTFQGGELILYDATPEEPWSLSRYTRFTPRNNCLVVFPSSAFHQVTVVHSSDTRPEYGRFALNGWLRD